MSGQPRRFIIDTDTASDDAVAIMMALAAESVQVDALTIVAGNVSLEQASINARYTLELCGADVPVYNGCDRPWLREAAPADWFHGDDGMGNQYYPAPRLDAQPNHAVNELVERFAACPGEITLITLGPLTNIATALAVTPEMAQQIKHCYVMGGAANTVGNVTPAAEYNIWCDPEAARRVLHSGMPVTLLGWELSRDAATLDDQEMAAIRDLGNPRAEVAIDCNAHALRAVRDIQGEAGLALADPVAMAVALDERIGLEWSTHYVDIAVSDELVRGMTVVDRLNVTGKPANARVCFSIDAKRWKSLLIESLS